MTDDRQLIEAAMQDDWEPPSPHGPIRNPVDRFQRSARTIGNFIERSAGPVGRAIENAVTKQGRR